MTQTVPARQDIASGREQSWVYFNGDIVRYADAKVGLLTHALNYGTGIFEGIRAYWNERKEQLFVMRMPEHYERMQVNARTMLMKLEPSIDELCAVSLELLRRNAYREDAYLRPLLFKAAEVIGVRLHDVPESLGIVTTPMGDYVGTEGIRCMISSWRRIDDNMAPVRAKATGLYVNAALAKSEALQAGFDEAIRLRHDGHVSEGSWDNIFVVRPGQLLTPPPSDNILEGIMPATIIHHSREELGLEVQQRPIDRTELYMSDEIFMCGTGAQVAPVIEVDRRRIGDGEPGPMSLRLKDLYLDLARGDSAKYAEWLTPVY